MGLLYCFSKFQMYFTLFLHMVCITFSFIAMSETFNLSWIFEILMKQWPLLDIFFFCKCKTIQGAIFILLLICIIQSSKSKNSQRIETNYKEGCKMVVFMILSHFLISKKKFINFLLLKFCPLIDWLYIV